MDAERARQAFLWACTLDVAVPKPGNVSLDAPGHGMTAAQFVHAAQAAAAALFAPGAAVGARIEGAVRASLAAAGCNTNLGIVLLIAPLAAALQRIAGPCTVPRLRSASAETLAALSREDAECAFRAIALANPGGLGTAPQQDVRSAPTVTLGEAMHLAAARDRIARQYAENFCEVFDIGVPCFAHQTPQRAMLLAFLSLLAAGPDSHIVRKSGAAAAHNVTARAADLLAAWRGHGREPEAAMLMQWDRDLKAAGLNPGTCADLAVASAFVAAITGTCECTPVPLAWNVFASQGDAGASERTFRRHQMPKIDRVLVGESLVGDGNEVAHIDLIMGPRGSAAEAAFCNCLTNNKDGFTSLLAVVAPNLLAKPNTVMFNKVTIKGAKQAVQMFGPAQRAVAMAVADSVEAGVIPADEADDVFICVGVFIHWLASDDKKIQEYNYKATREAILRAVNREPKARDVVAKKGTVDHPFQAMK